MTSQIEDRFYYLVSDYSATGEGRTVTLMITPLRPKDEEYDRPPSFEQDAEGAFQFDPGYLDPAKINTVLKRQFIDQFDEWTAMGAEVLTREQFFDAYDIYVPKMAREMSRDAVEDIPANFGWYAQLHFNFS